MALRRFFFRHALTYVTSMTLLSLGLHWYTWYREMSAPERAAARGLLVGTTLVTAGLFWAVLHLLRLADRPGGNPWHGAAGFVLLFEVITLSPGLSSWARSDGQDLPGLVELTLLFAVVGALLGLLVWALQGPDWGAKQAREADPGTDPGPSSS